MSDEKCPDGRLAKDLSKGDVRKAYGDTGYNMGNKAQNKEGISTYRNPLNRQFLNKP